METKKNMSKTLQLVTCALFAAIIAVSAQVTVPNPITGVPISLQTFGVALCAAVGGCALGTISTSVYIFLGAVGLPVFASMKGGFAVLFGPTGGFLFGFIAMAFLCGLPMKNLPLRIAVSCAGLLICYICGAVQFAIVAQTDIINSIVLVILPYVIKDVLSIVAAQYMAIPIRKAISSMSSR